MMTSTTTMMVCAVCSKWRHAAIDVIYYYYNTMFIYLIERKIKTQMEKSQFFTRSHNDSPLHMYCTLRILALTKNIYAWVFSMVSIRTMPHRSLNPKMHQVKRCQHAVMIISSRRSNDIHTNANQNEQVGGSVSDLIFIFLVVWNENVSVGVRQELCIWFPQPIFGYSFVSHFSHLLFEDLSADYSWFYLHRFSEAYYCKPFSVVTSMCSVVAGLFFIILYCLLLPRILHAVVVDFAIVLLDVIQNRGHTNTHILCNHLITDPK